MNQFGVSQLKEILLPRRKLDFSIKQIHLQNPALASFANLRESHEHTCILESATGAERLAELSISQYSIHSAFSRLARAGENRRQPQ